MITVLVAKESSQRPNQNLQYWNTIDVSMMLNNYETFVNSVYVIEQCAFKSIFA